MTLLASAAVRRAAVRRAAAAPLLQRSAAGTDRRTDGRTPYHYIDPAANYASSVNETVHSDYRLSMSFEDRNVRP